MQGREGILRPPMATLGLLRSQAIVLVCSCFAMFFLAITNVLPLGSCCGGYGEERGEKSMRGKQRGKEGRGEPQSGVPEGLTIT